MTALTLIPALSLIVWLSPAPQTGPAPATATQPAPKLEPRLEKLLADLEAKGKGVKSVRTDLKRTLHLRIWRRTNISTGTLMFLRPDLFRIDLVRPRKESYICDGKSFYEVKQRTKQILEYPIPKEKQGKALDRPPINFLIGGPAEDAKRQYAIRWVSDDEKTITIELTPREGTQCDFTKALLTFDRKQLVPTRIHRWLRKKRQTEETHEFTHTKINVDVKPATFARPRLPAGWTWEKPQPR